MTTPLSVFVCLEDLLNMDAAVKFPTVSNSEKPEYEDGISAVSVYRKGMETAGSQGKSYMRNASCNG